MIWTVLTIAVILVATAALARANGAEWKGADLGVYGWGAVLVIGISLIALNMWFAAGCISPGSSEPSKLDLSHCGPAVAGWYLVLHDWQTGIGAVIGLLGVAWSAFYSGKSTGAALRDVSGKLDKASETLTLLTRKMS